MNKIEDICAEHIKTQKNSIKEIEGKIGGKVIFFDGELNPRTLLCFHKVLRKLKWKNNEQDTLFLLLESPGGSIDSAVKIVNMSKEYFNNFNVVIPSFAKSAATLIAVSSDKLYLGRAGELGPIDPQVRHPLQKNLFFPALSIKDAIEFISESKDKYVKMALTEKIDPYLMGTYKRILSEAEQYLERANLVKNSTCNKDAIIKELTRTYISHGYPIDIKECGRIGIKLTKFDEKNEKQNDEIWDLIYNFFENHVEFQIEHNKEIDVGVFVMSDDIDDIKIETNTPKTNMNLKITPPSGGETIDNTQ